MYKYVSLGYLRLSDFVDCLIEARLFSTENWGRNVCMDMMVQLRVDQAMNDFSWGLLLVYMSCYASGELVNTVVYNIVYPLSFYTDGSRSNALRYDTR